MQMEETSEGHLVQYPPQSRADLQPLSCYPGPDAWDTIANPKDKVFWTPASALNHAHGEKHFSHVQFEFLSCSL